MSKRQEKDKKRDAALGPSPAAPGMSRDMRRMMKKRESAADRLTRPTPVKKKRKKPLEFFREIRGELGRVAWPRRKEVLTYTIVVLISVSFFMAVIGGMDFIAAKGVLELMKRGGK